jgi:gamma-glutamyl-gamma-aminobutyraldehyde dehydrogenase
MIEQKHLDRVLGYIQTGVTEGAELVYGGQRILQETGGLFLKPAVFDGVLSDMTVYREEIFGPVFGVSTFETLDEAIQMANDTPYGLQASVWCNDVNAVHRLSRGMRAGTISVNCYSEGDIGTPFGGFKQSGFFGRDKSLWANRQYTELKTIWTQIR